MKKKKAIALKQAAVFLAVLSSPLSSHALSITVGTTTITDGGAGDTNAAGGVIDFSLVNVNGVTGIYNISGTVNETSAGTTNVTSGATLTLTNLDIQAVTGTVNDTIIFDSSVFAPLGLPANGTAAVDGAWTSGASNTPAAIAGSDVTLSGWTVGNWEWNAMVGTNQEFVSPFAAASALSNAGASFNDPGVTQPMPDLITPWFGQTLVQADWTSLRGKLEFNLANSGDGLWMPGSADLVAGDVPAVPVPAAFWLFASGIAGLFAYRKKH